MADIVQKKLEDARRDRIVYYYTIPASASHGEPRRVGLVELTAKEELLAAKRSHNEGAKLAYEMAKLSLVDIDGKRMSTTDGSADTEWDSMPPKMRNLVIQAFADLHSPKDDDTAVFLSTRQAQAG